MNLRLSTLTVGLLALSTYTVSARAERAAPDASQTLITPTDTAAERARAKRTARRWFDRGLALYNTQDFTGALAEFRRAYDLVPHPVVLLNVVLTYAQLNDPVACVRAAEQLRTLDTSKLDPNALRAVDVVYAEQRARIAELAIQSNVTDVAIQVDGIDIGKAPVTSLQVPAGEHIVSAVATGHIPRRIRLHLEPQSRKALDVSLEPLERALAHLQIRTPLPDVEVWVDEERVGKTPLPASLAFSPGTHHVELRRAAYLPVRRSITLDPGSTGELDFELIRDPLAPSHALGHVALKLSEPNSLVRINGEPKPVNSRSLELPRGLHRVEVSHEGFLPYSRIVEVGAEETVLSVILQPTPQFLDAYVQRANATRTWSIVGIAGGASFIGAGTAFLLFNLEAKHRAKREFDRFAGDVAESTAGACGDAACERELDRLVGRLKDARDRDAIGWVGVGAGITALAAGVSLFVLGEDPERYAPSRASDVFGSLGLTVGPGQLALHGAF